MKPFDNFLLEHGGKGSRLQWGDSHVVLVRKTASGIRSQSLPIPAEWRNAGGPKLARWEKPWLRVPGKPKARTKHLAPVVWQESETIHPAGFTIIRKRETGGTRETFRIDDKGDSGKAFAIFALRAIWAHLLFSLPRPLARKLANPAERRAILENAATPRFRSIPAAIAHWIREAEREESESHSRHERETRKAKKQAKRNAKA